MQPQLSRGYTRAADYLFDSDDEVPLPKPQPHPVVSARLLGGTSLHPPPPKQLRGSAVSAPMAKGIETAITADPGQCYPKPMHPYQQLAPQAFRLPVPATVHELGGPPPPAVSARPKPAKGPAVSAQPKPAKGSNRDDWGRLNPLNEGTPWSKPRISMGFDNVGDGAPWRQIAVSQYIRKPWPMWGRGVIDFRPNAGSGMVAGRLLRHALAAAIQLIRSTPCEHKIGICRCPYVRFFGYQEQDSRWSPWLLALLASTTTREGASMMEASLILQLEDKAVNIENNINWTISCDYGGEGRKKDDEAHFEHYVYLAVKPLPRRPGDEAAAASAHQHEEHFGERAAAASAHQHD